MLALWGGQVSSAGYYLLPHQVKRMGEFLRESRVETGGPARSGGGILFLAWLLAELQNHQAHPGLAQQKNGAC